MFKKLKVEYIYLKNVCKLPILTSVPASFPMEWDSMFSLHPSPLGSALLGLKKQAPSMGSLVLWLLVSLGQWLLSTCNGLDSPKS